MLEANVPEVLRRIATDDRVLDVGGWARCFNRADHVIDKFPYATRGARYQEHLGLGPQGGDTERFSESTWVARDLCDREPWPYPDRFFDFCTCSHTLEDIRDPLWVCSEMQRVSKRGYIEVPSMRFELTRGREAGVPVGLSHHFWVIERRGDELIFHPKSHHVHGDPRMSLPASAGVRLSPLEEVTYLFWDGEIRAKEGWLHPEVVRGWVESWGPFPENEQPPVPAEVERRAARAEVEGEALRARVWEAGEQLRWESEQHRDTRASLIEIDRRLAEEHARAERALEQVEALERALSTCRAELDRFAGLGPGAVRLARGLQRVSRAIPGRVRAG